MLAVAAAILALAAPSAHLVAAGDVGDCNATADEATARLLDRLPGTIALLGDSVYERGSPAEYRRCFAWARHRSRIKPAVGNHEYGTPGAAGYFAYFRVPQWYSYDLVPRPAMHAGFSPAITRRQCPPSPLPRLSSLGRGRVRPLAWCSRPRSSTASPDGAPGAWHVVVLNTNCGPAGGCGADSPQARWLRADLAAHPTRCTLAYAHHPRFSSGLHGSDTTIDALWRILRARGVDVYLSGHDHDYERFAPRGGLRQFVVGTGGRGLYPILHRIPGSQAAQSRAHGVLALTLSPDGYSWRFVPIAGDRYTDSGSAGCR